MLTFRFAPLAMLMASVAMPGLATAQTYSTVAQPQSDADALAAAVRRLGANPKDIDALATAGELSLRLGDESAAAAFFARAEKVDPRNARVKAGEAALLVHEERPGEALRYFDQAIGFGIDPARIAAERGLAYDLIGEPDRAQRDYRLALRSGGENPEVTRRYALSLGISGKRDLALQLLDPLIHAQDRGAWRARAFILAMNGDEKGANTIATTMMPGGMGAGLQPFFERLPTMSAADRAFAVHFGEVRATPQRIADARLAPVLPALAPDPTAPVEVAARPATVPVQVAQATAQDRRGGKTRAPDHQRTTQAAPRPPAHTLQTVQSLPGQTGTPAAPTSPVSVAQAPVTPTPVPASPPPVQTAAAVPPQAQTSLFARPFAAGEAERLAEQRAQANASLAAAAKGPRADGAASATAAANTAVSDAARPALAPTPQISAATATPPVTAPITPSAAPAPAPAQVAATTPTGGIPAVAASTPVPPRMSEDSILARIIANIKVPDSEMAEAPTAPAQPPAKAENRPARGAETNLKPVSTRKSGAKSADPEQVSAAPETPAIDRKALAKKKAADLKAAAEKKALAEQKAAEAKAAKADPARYWVQVAGGANGGDLSKAWKSVQGKASALKGKAAYSTPLRATNRVVTGPFKTEDEAQAFVNTLARQGISAFTFASAKGQKMTKIEGK